MCAANKVPAAISSLQANTAVGFKLVEESNWRVRFTPDSNEYSPGRINFLSSVILLALSAACVDFYKHIEVENQKLLKRLGCG